MYFMHINVSCRSVLLSNKIDDITCWPWDNNLPPNQCGQVHVTRFVKFLTQ